MNIFKLSLKKLFLICFFFTYSLNAFSKDIHFKNSHCVAWKTKKRIMLLKSLEPVGMNCSIKAKFKKKGSEFYIEVSVPIEKFDSEEPMRDKEVSKILKANIQPNLIISTKAYSLNHWKMVFNSSNFKTNLNLKIANSEFALVTIAKKIEVKGTNVILGKVITNFSSLSLKPPGFAWGLITKVSDYLELHYKIDLTKIEGLKKIIIKP